MSEKVFPLDLSEVASPEIVKEVEETLGTAKRQDFRNIVLAMQNIEYMDITDALTDHEISHFRANPCTYFANSSPEIQRVLWDAAMTQLSPLVVRR